MRWNLRQTEGRTALLEIAWHERNGPPVILRQTGVLDRASEHGLMHTFGGAVQLEFHVPGMKCRICLRIAAKTEEASLKS